MDLGPDSSLIVSNTDQFVVCSANNCNSMYLNQPKPTLQQWLDFSKEIISYIGFW